MLLVKTREKSTCEIIRTLGSCRDLPLQVRGAVTESKGKETDQVSINNTDKGGCVGPGSSAGRHKNY